MRRLLVWVSLVLCSLVVVGVVVQLYLIAAWIFGESGALGPHKTVGAAIVHPAEILAFLFAFGSRDPATSAERSSFELRGPRDGSGRAPNKGTAPR